MWGWLKRWLSRNAFENNPLLLKIRTLTLVFLLNPVLLLAQGSDIRSLDNLAWKRILQKAQAEKKYVFVECSAISCEPCEWMGKNVYSDDSITRYIDDKFIYVKMELDSSSWLDGAIKKWYSTFDSSIRNFKVTEYPSYLFFSPEGQLVHEGVGAMKKKEFITLSEMALDHRRQFYYLLSMYEQGKMDVEDMPYLADAAIKLHNDSLAIDIAWDYIHHYLTRLPAHEIWTRGSVNIINRYRVVVHSRDSIFNWYFLDRAKIDSIMNRPGYADRLINFVIYREEVYPKVSLDSGYESEPNWHQIEKELEQKYGHKYVKENVLKGRVEYYRRSNSWERYAKYFIKEMQMANIQNWPSGQMSVIALNNDAFEVFKYSNRKRELKIALSWAKRAEAMSVHPFANVIDTKANLLYKLGRKSQALVLEERAHNLDPNDDQINATYERMKKGMKTW